MKEYFDDPIFIIMLNLNTKVHEAVSLIEAHEVF